MISRQPCPWDITLNRLRETEIELEEKPKLDHSFVSFLIYILIISNQIYRSEKDFLL
jgi:hypothetical protein